jgi:hypothetical protein
MVRLLIAVALGLAAVGVALLLQRRRRDAPTQGSAWTVPAQLDRADFAHPEVPWLVAAFTSATCQTCAAVWSRVEVLGSDDVAVVNLEAKVDRAVHARYRIDAVPLVVVADAEGVVRRYFLGPLTATDLWGALAELRQPGTLPAGCAAAGAAATDRRGGQGGPADQGGPVGPPAAAIDGPGRLSPG